MVLSTGGAIAISGTPSAGQSLVATGANTAAWNNISDNTITEVNQVTTYSTGTAYQSGTTITGVGTTFPSVLSAYGPGGTIVWAYYSTGTASQSGTTITGVGTT